MFTNSKLAALLLLLLLHEHVHAGRIVGGQEAQPHSRPYMVLLEKKHGGQTKYCGGFLLNEEFVLTAAHCEAETYVAILGFHIVAQNEGVQRIPVQQEILYNDDPETVFSNDLMLLKLSSKAKFTNQVRPINLAEQDDGSLPCKCSVAGWGKTLWSSNHLSNKLMEVNIELINSESCAQQHFYCSVGLTGPHQGDSGGPLVCEDGKAYGLVSHIFSDQNGKHEFRFTKIPDYIDWIKSTMNKNM